MHHPGGSFPSVSLHSERAALLLAWQQQEPALLPADPLYRRLMIHQPRTNTSTRNGLNVLPSRSILACNHSHEASTVAFISLSEAPINPVGTSVLLLLTAERFDRWWHLEGQRRDHDDEDEDHDQGIDGFYRVSVTEKRSALPSCRATVSLVASFLPVQLRKKSVSFKRPERLQGHVRLR